MAVRAEGRVELAEPWVSERNTTQACQAVSAASRRLHTCPQHDGDEGLGVSSHGSQASSEQEKGAHTSFSL